ncbi:MAG: hypothetical protein EOO88_13270 [Pedobacter sp.]|nr:MAG: hypothetical protein EOO88_13270 [Pedobacter sp.]
MTKIRLLTISVAALVLINIFTASWFLMQSPGTRGTRFSVRDNEGPKAIIIHRLNFDSAQVIKYEMLIKVHRSTVKKLNDSISSVKNKLYSSLTGNATNSQDTLFSKLAGFQQRIEMTHYKHFIDIRNLCRPSQRSSFNALTKDLADYFTSQRRQPVTQAH